VRQIWTEAPRFVGDNDNKSH